ncbi:hypothetical protein [uncultured Marinobacter sp.]|uniref:hypothetical protein n=1 Tax=uncultured Marinobacter sp. TaxID=187379 RepID=UPI0030DD5F59
MAIQFTNEEQSPFGFSGWRVTATLRGKHYRKDFSLRPPGKDIPEALWHRYQKTRAEYYDARWAMRAAAIGYLDVIRTEHPNTQPYRGVGFRGMTLGIGPITKGGNDECYMEVAAPGRPLRVVVSQEQPLSKAWERAVNLWGEVFGIRAKDVEHKRRNPPQPEQFKRLRTHLNEHEKAGIPVSVLHHVFAEQRAEIERQKSRRQLKERVIEQDELLDVHARLEREISEFMEKSGARA